MVGRFVQHQEIGLLDEQTGQVGAHDPATAQFTSGALKILFLKTEPCEELFGLGLALEIKMSLIMLMGSWRNRGYMQDGLITYRCAFLREETDTHSPLEDHLTVIG